MIYWIPVDIMSFNIDVNHKQMSNKISNILEPLYLIHFLVINQINSLFPCDAIWHQRYFAITKLGNASPIIQGQTMTWINFDFFINWAIKNTLQGILFKI